MKRLLMLAVLLCAGCGDEVTVWPGVSWVVVPDAFAPWPADMADGGALDAGDDVHPPVVVTLVGEGGRR